ncbi:hypothetical protein CTAM01_09349 [Colletotrichum tamarilloi]|uniref:Uncharacterized protein n=1 Tax=Colletotrichum tamarilloi TaxID=1209934 RepID=A0ABQ9R3Q1_9PEZI|nr:uncharacterized protein CTAM01_09349 [Colletotrichum tamarilloi]KAK1493888.1 hypothetical protein CTAM01_09349 [Colletotrichum tamarilloi]
MLHRRRFVKTSTVNHSQRDVDVAPFQIPSTSRKAMCPSKHALMSFRKPYRPVAIGCLVAVSVACHTLILHFSNLNYHDPFLSRTLKRPLSSNVACRVLHRAGNPTFDSNHVHVQVGVSERPFTAPGPSGSVPYIRFQCQLQDSILWCLHFVHCECCGIVWPAAYPTPCPVSTQPTPPASSASVSLHLPACRASFPDGCQSSTMQPPSTKPNYGTCRKLWIPLRAAVPRA